MSRLQARRTCISNFGFWDCEHVWVLWVCGCAGINFANNGAALRANACARPATMMTRSGRGARSEPARERQTWLSRALNPASLLPGLIIGFLLGLWVEVPKGGFSKGFSRQDPDPPDKLRKGSKSRGRQGSGSSSSGSGEVGGDLKMVFVVRQDLKMGGGKIASQCAHAAVGIYHELLTRQRTLLNKWEECGQPKIVVTCKNQQELNGLRDKADRAGLPTFTVADAGRTQVAAGSKTVLVIGPGSKTSVDTITRHLKLL